MTCSSKATRENKYYLSRWAELYFSRAPARNWCTTRLQRMRRGSGKRQPAHRKFLLKVAMGRICSGCSGVQPSTIRRLKAYASTSVSLS